MNDIHTDIRDREDATQYERVHGVAYGEPLPESTDEGFEERILDAQNAAAEPSDVHPPTTTEVPMHALDILTLGVLGVEFFAYYGDNALRVDELSLDPAATLATWKDR